MAVSRCSQDEEVLVDNDTGEILAPLLLLKCLQTVHGDDETGEETQMRLVYQRSKFRVPRSALKSPVFETAVLDSKKDSDKIFDLTLLVLPLLVLLPGWAVILYILGEMMYHNWAHAHEDTHTLRRTPMHLLFNASCAECVSKQQMQKVGKLQDELTHKIHSRRILNYMPSLA